MHKTFEEFYPALNDVKRSIINKAKQHSTKKGFQIDGHVGLGFPDAAIWLGESAI